MDRPTLPLEEQAAIERIREAVLEHALVTYDLLFPKPLRYHVEEQFSVRSHVPKPASLKLQLQEHASNLFDAEAKVYAKHSHCEPELRQWLGELVTELVTSIMNEAKTETSMDQTKLRASVLNFHCPPTEQTKAIREGLAKRTEHWMRVAKEAPEVRSAWAPEHELISTLPAPRENAEAPKPDESKSTKHKRLPSTITSKLAAARLEVFLEASPIEKTDFAGKVGITPRTLLSFRTTGKIKRVTLQGIAREMGITVEDLLRPD